MYVHEKEAARSMYAHEKERAAKPQHVAKTGGKVFRYAHKSSENRYGHRKPVDGQYRHKPNPAGVRNGKFGMSKRSMNQVTRRSSGGAANGKGNSGNRSGRRTGRNSRGGRRAGRNGRRRSSRKGGRKGRKSAAGKSLITGDYHRDYARIRRENEANGRPKNLGIPKPFSDAINLHLPEPETRVKGLQKVLPVQRSNIRNLYAHVYGQSDLDVTALNADRARLEKQRSTDFTRVTDMIRKLNSCLDEETEPKRIACAAKVKKGLTQWK